MDIVGSVLDGLKLQSTVFCSIELFGNWGFRKDALQGAPFHAILSGEAWLRMPGTTGVTRLAAGDVVILPHGDRHDLSARPDGELIPFKTVLDRFGLAMWSPGAKINPAVLWFGEGEHPTCRLVSGVFGFGDRRGNPLLEALPPIFHLKASDMADAGDGWLAATVSFLAAEVAGQHAGSAAVAARLADILLIQAIRRYIASEDKIGQGWLRGLTDPQIGRALSLMHAQPDRPWSVRSLAEAAGMSRSRFAVRFLQIVGQTPLDYLTHWRMYQAAGKLLESNVGLTTLAEQAGYKSEMAFSKAFKRWAGQSPAEFKRLARSEMSSR